MEAAVHAISHSINLVAPEAVLILSACGILLLAALVPSRKQSEGWPWLSLLAIFGAFVAWFFVRHSTVEDLTASPFRADAVGHFVRLIGLICGIALVLVGWTTFSGLFAGECQACLLLIVAGTNLVACANDLVGVFLALELISIPTYLLLYLVREDADSQEATIKYFLLSIFSSAPFLFGASFLYGATGSTNLEVIRTAFVAAPGTSLPTYLLIAAIFIVAGLGFRITAVPFHFYAPDVFQGTRTPIAAMLAVIPKVAGFVALLRLIGSWLPEPKLAEAAPTVASQVVVMLWALAILTMVLGNILALLQDNLKRLLAYSSVAHAGYMLVGLAAARGADHTIAGGPALLFYLAVYGAMTVGIFAVLNFLESPDSPIETVDDVAGLSQTHPVLAAIAALFLFSLTGLPPAAGFFGKLLLLQAAWAQDTIAFRVLAVLMAINAAIGGYYYLRVVATMYLKPPKRAAQTIASFSNLVGVGICAGITFGLFIAPNLLWKLISSANI